MNLTLLIYAIYILVPLALILMIKNYKPINWLWMCLLVLSIFIGIGPYVALAYIAVELLAHRHNDPLKSSNSPITYHNDGSYVVYRAVETKKTISPAVFTFKVIGGLIAGIAIAYGLLVVGLAIFVAVSCGGNSKCM